MASVFFFVVIAFSISSFHYKFKGFPGININIEGLLLFILCTYILFNLDIQMGKPIFYQADFWICLGILIFFGGTFFYNGIYTQLVNLDELTALKLFGIINKPLNLILYSLISIGILCLNLKKKLFIL